MNIWIDLDNSPHVHFFAPIIRLLEQAGVQTVVTVRAFSQTEELARGYGLSFATIGEHRTPRSTPGRIAGTLKRAGQLAGYIRSHRPVAAVSHGSRALAIAAWTLRIPALTLYDYEFVSARIFCKLSRRVLVPSVIPMNRLKEQGLDVKRFVQYPGLKEEVYVYDFEPDAGILCKLALDPSRLIVAVRPPATWAHYHDRHAETLFRSLVERLRREPGAQVMVLPRTPQQADECRQKYRMEGAPFRVLCHAVDALSLMWYSDAVFSGGGTMVREAALLGVEAFSTFAGKLGAADKALAAEGKLKLLRQTDEVDRLQLRKRSPGPAAYQHSRRTRDFIFNQILSFARGENARSGVRPIP